MTEILNKIKSATEFNSSETFDIYRHCAATLIQNEEEGSNLLIHILNSRVKFSSSLDEMLADLVESIGFYPYLKKENLNLSSTSSKIRQTSSLSENIHDKYFHEEQKYVLELLSSNKNIIVSAPTSFGKSLLIEEIVASYKYQNIVVIQPTLALLDETRKKLSKYEENYKIIVRTSQEASSEKSNLFLLTAERVNEYQNLPDIDFLIIDEFYKLSSKRDDERSDSLNNAFRYILEKYDPKFYLLGPNIEGISDGFSEKYNAIFYKTKYSLVGCEEVDIYQDHKGKFGSRGEKKKYKEKVLFDLLYDLRIDNTIIYCSSPARSRYLSVEFLKYLISKNEVPKNKKLSIIDWIEAYVSEDWSLIDCLKYGIGFHDGALQKHLTSSIIDYFNSGILKTLFCTATIIEGVNTAAKNVIFFDYKKGKDTPIDFFDYSNIKGRAGRLMEHYVGRVFNFNPTPKYDQVYIDIPFFEQNPISDEVLINISNENILDKESEQYHYLSSLPENEKEIFSRNSLYIRGQDSLISRIRQDIKSNYDLIFWDSTPKYKQLEYCLGLAWDYLIKPGENLNPMTKKKIVKVTFDYGINKSIIELVNNNLIYKKNLERYDNWSDKEILDESIRDSFQILRHWFQYKIPKWLLVVNELQRYVCSELGVRPGNYTFYASSIESDFIRENLTILAEYGVPRSAIDKIAKYIDKDLNQDLVIQEIISKGIHKKPEFLSYEREKLVSNYTTKNV
ncbi:DEAD/DEAH box helicase [Shewanella inventionis]|uniref:DEAD/DEAH box helicase n=1 Tax=Shewanella inventionis TaxID=1738770 RepID=UPI001CBB8287|nr:DEAD/DEAH box helicase [Shewanella inventionis]UAL45040.1 DEAD/DEAH box helicase [Shewanella inventionis]